MLFLAVVLLPSGVLVFLATRSAQQARELETRRIVEEQARVAGQLEQTLLATLNAVKSRLLVVPSDTSLSTEQPADPRVQMVSPVVDGRLVLPWESGVPSKPPKIEYSLLIHRGEQAEFLHGNYSEAKAAFSRAIPLASSPAEAAAARLGTARTTAKAGRPKDARIEYLRLLHTAPDVVDAAGVPYQLYAATTLVRSDPAEVIGELRSTLGGRCCLSAEATSVLSSVAETAKSINQLSDGEYASWKRGVNRMIDDTRKIVALKNRFPTFGLTTTGATRWIVFGERPWFVTSGALDKNHSIAIGIDANTVLNDVNQSARLTAGARLVVGGIIADKVPEHHLSADLQRVAVIFARADTVASATGAFYLAMLVVVIGMILFASTLLWVDVRREMHLAQLRSDFVASVSHELKTPLTAIRMFAETLLLDRSADEERRQGYLDTIVNESERLTRLLNNVLDLSKIEQGGKSFNLDRADLRDIVARAAQTMQYSLAQNDLRLIVSVADDAGWIAADRDAVHQAILNLLTNAMKYSERGSEIYLSADVAGDEAIMEVRDRGIGIPAAHRSRVTEKFYRVPTEENARIPGTGLGLTLVDYTVRGHHGTLEIGSNDGKGAVVRMRFPRGLSA